MMRVSRYPKLKTVAILAILVALSAFPATVNAIADPDTPPAINAVYVYEDLLEEGDVGVFIDYFLDYTVTPNETATESFMAIFIDTDGATQLQSVAPYTFTDSGYGRGNIWLYFSASEVTTHGIDSANIALYEIWLVGNPTLAWPGDPPKTVAGIDSWQTSGDASTLVALRVLFYADVLELLWSVDMVEATSVGNRLTATGASYYTNVITGLRAMAPNCFADSTVTPIDEDIDYTSTFGATMTDGTGIVTGSVITFTEGSTVVTVTGAGTFVLELEQGTTGNVTDGTGTVTGSPVDLVAGINAITVVGIGTFTVDVNLVDTAAIIEDTIIGTAFDLTTAATAFGMSRLMFSGLVWLVVSIIICAGVYKLSSQQGTVGGGKAVLIVFDICILGGAALGLMSLIVAALLFIGFGVLTGYVLFFRGANI